MLLMKFRFVRITPERTTRMDYSIPSSPCQQKNPRIFRSWEMESGGDLLSRAVSSQVPSALKGLTSVFGMGTGGTPSPLPPEIVSLFGPDFQTLAQHAIPCLHSSLRASRVYTAFHPVPLANPDNCTSYFEFFSSSPFPGLSLNEAFDRLVAATFTRYRAPSAALSTC